MIRYNEIYFEVVVVNSIGKKCILSEPPTLEGLKMAIEAFQNADTLPEINAEMFRVYLSTWEDGRVALIFEDSAPCIRNQNPELTIDQVKTEIQVFINKLLNLKMN